MKKNLGTWDKNMGENKMEEKLIKTDTIWYKIKSFFTKVFRKEEYTYETNKELPKMDLKTSLKEENLENERKEKLANELLLGGIGCSDLTEEELEEMKEYFTKDIKRLDAEILRTKQHILQMKKQLSK